MSTEYTPTTDVVRLRASSVQISSPYVEHRKVEAKRRAEFDRWFAGEIRKAKVEAWEVGFSRGFYKAQVMPSNADASEATTPNPYEGKS